MNFFEKDQLPIGNGGGTCKTIKDVEKLLATAISVIEIGTITFEARLGNEGNVQHDGITYTLNSLGMPNPGIKYYRENLPKMIEMIHEKGKKVIVNIAGFSGNEWIELSRLAVISGADFTLLNYGCPNIWVRGSQKTILSYDYGLKKFDEITRIVIINNQEYAKQGRIGIKLSPIIDPVHMSTVANLINRFSTLGYGHIGFVTSQNTVPNCYDEDTTGKSFVDPAGGLAGMGGNAILPMALGQVRQLRALLKPNIKIIGVGGVDSGEGVIKMLHVGADFVQITSAYYFKEDPGVFNYIGAEYIELKAFS